MSNTDIKLFEKRQVRTTWSEAEEKWYFLVEDVVFTYLRVVRYAILKENHKKTHNILYLTAQNKGFINVSTNILSLSGQKIVILTRDSHYL